MFTIIEHVFHIIKYLSGIIFKELSIADSFKLIREKQFLNIYYKFSIKEISNVGIIKFDKRTQLLNIYSKLEVC